MPRRAASCAAFSRRGGQRDERDSLPVERVFEGPSQEAVSIARTLHGTAIGLPIHPN